MRAVSAGTWPRGWRMCSFGIWPLWLRDQRSHRDSTGVNAELGWQQECPALADACCGAVGCCHSDLQGTAREHAYTPRLCRFCAPLIFIHIGHPEPYRASWSLRHRAANGMHGRVERLSSCVPGGPGNSWWRQLKTGLCCPAALHAHPSQAHGWQHAWLSHARMLPGPWSATCWAWATDTAKTS